MSTKTNAKPENIDFETSLKELESVVHEMEQGNLSLAHSLAHFEKGIQLTRQCQTILQNAEQKVKILAEQTPQAELKPFQTDENT